MTRIEWQEIESNESGTVSIQQKILIAEVLFEKETIKKDKWFETSGFTEIARYNEFREIHYSYKTMYYEHGESKERTSSEIKSKWGDGSLTCIEIKPPIQPSEIYPSRNIRLINGNKIDFHKIEILAKKMGEQY